MGIFPRVFFVARLPPEDASLAVKIFDRQGAITYRSVSFMSRPVPHSQTRQLLLRAALRHFANRGYAAASVQSIVDDAGLSKPALYYHFKDKAGLFQALVHEAHDERYRLMCAAAGQSREICGQLEGILAVLFDYFHQNRELMRISFATMFAAPGELPSGLDYADKCARNFEFVHALIAGAQKRGELKKRFPSREMAFGFYGLVNAYLTSHLVLCDVTLDKKNARRIVALFLAGAATKKKTE